MGWSACLIFNIQCPPSSGENWDVVTSHWTHHQTWWTSVPDQATGGLQITDRTPPFEPSWSSVFDRIVASSSCVAFFFTNVTGLVMCSIWKDHPMTSIFVLYALKFLWWIIGLPSIEKSFISCIALSWLPSFSGEWWSEWTWSWLCASSSLKLQSCPEVTRNQSDTCSDFIKSTIVLIWCEFDILHYLCLNLSWLKKNLSWSIILLFSSSWCDVVEESIGSSIRSASSGCFLGVFVVTNTSDVPGARISDPCTDRRWWIFSC
jgi:hypothetical protein